MIINIINRERLRSQSFPRCSRLNDDSSFEVIELSIKLTDSVKKLLKETADQLKGASKRRFQAQTVVELGYGGQLLAEKELGWDRVPFVKE